MIYCNITHYIFDLFSQVDSLGLAEDGKFKFVILSFVFVLLLTLSYIHIYTAVRMGLTFFPNDPDSAVDWVLNSSEAFMKDI